MRKFKETIFFGNESCLEKCYLLHKRLEEAFNIISGLQQPDHSDSEESKRKNEEERKELNDIILDLRTALDDESLNKLTYLSLFERKFIKFIVDHSDGLDDELYKKELINYNKFDGLIDFIQL